MLLSFGDGAEGTMVYPLTIFGAIGNDNGYPSSRMVALFESSLSRLLDLQEYSYQLGTNDCNKNLKRC